MDEIKSGEEFKNNEILHSLITALESNKPEVQKVVENLDPSREDLLEMCLEANDDLNKTTERYDDLKKGKRPKPFSATSKCLQKQSKPQPKPVVQSTPVQSNPFDKFGDFGQSFKDFRESPQQPAAQKAQPKKTVNLLDMDDDEPVKNEKKEESTVNKAPNTIDDFLNMNESTSNPKPQPTQQEVKPEQNVNLVFLEFLFSLTLLMLFIIRPRLLSHNRTRIITHCLWDKVNHREIPSP